jgi:hypothetical protein
MRTFRHIRCSALLVSLILLAHGVSASDAQQTAGDTVWNRAVEQAGRGRLTPQAAIVRTTGSGAGGVSEIETWVTFRTDSSGELHSTIVHRREGAKVLDRQGRERRNEIDTRRRRAAPFRIDEIPLHPKLQPLVSYRRVGDGGGVVRFEFEMRRDEHEIFGTVAVSRSGDSVTIDFQPRPMPFGVRSFRSTLRMAGTAADGYRLESMTVVGEAGALWMRRSFRSEYRFLEELPAVGPR